MKNLKDVMKGIGSITKTSLLMLLVLITCTCSGPRLMLGPLNLEKQIDYSLYSGKLAKQTAADMECAIIKTDDPDFLLWHHQKQLTGQQFHLIHGLAYCPNLGPMLRKCSQTRWSLL